MLYEHKLNRKIIWKKIEQKQKKMMPDARCPMVVLLVVQNSFFPLVFRFDRFVNLAVNPFRNSESFPFKWMIVSTVIVMHSIIIYYY